MYIIYSWRRSAMKQIDMAKSAVKTFDGTIESSDRQQVTIEFPYKNISGTSQITKKRFEPGQDWLKRAGQSKSLNSSPLDRKTEQTIIFCPNVRYIRVCQYAKGLLISSSSSESMKILIIRHHFYFF